MSEFIKEENKEKATEEQVPVESSFMNTIKTLFKNNWGKLLAIICSYILGVFGGDATKATFNETLNTTTAIIELVSDLIKTESNEVPKEVVEEAEKIIEEAKKAVEEAKKAAEEAKQ